MDRTADIHFHFDPVCPFAWLTSRWVRSVARQRDYEVDWRFISLRLINEHIDYDTHFPPEYEHGHTAGLRMLRVCAAARERYGREVMGDLYTALGGSVFDVDPPTDQAAYRAGMGARETVEPLLRSLGLDASLADALDDESWDQVIRGETDEALERTGRDVGTPIIAYEPPDGPAFFGPVISRVPSDEDALRLWDAVLELTSFPGFAELKRSLRERPALRVSGTAPDQPGLEEDWHQGSRRLKK
jgi:2-hydroxychromene-2-carboxylate isomerase